jgi:hypothetical protein
MISPPLQCHPPPPRMKGVKSLPIIGPPWLFQPRRTNSVHGRNGISHTDPTNHANPQQRRLLYLYYRMHIVFIAVGTIFLTAMSIMKSFGHFPTFSASVDAIDPFDSESFQCSEIHNMSSWIQTPVHDQRFFPQYNQLSDFLDGQASLAEIDRWNDDPSGAAICKFRTDIRYWNHFPHA